MTRGQAASARGRSSASRGLDAESRGQASGSRGRSMSRARARGQASQGRSLSLRARPLASPQADFDEAPELQQLVCEANAENRRAAWEADVQSRLDVNDKLLREMHGMLVANAARDAAPMTSSLAAGAVPARFSAASDSSASTSTAAVASGSMPAVGAGATAPWPNAGALQTAATAGNNEALIGGQASSFTSSSLPMYAHVPMKIRTKIWAGEYVDMASLLPGRTETAQSYALSVRDNDAGAEPALFLAAKAKLSFISFQQWVKAFKICMSVYLMQPHAVAHAPALLKYMGVVRSLSERGGNWARYDETFRTMRNEQGWQWDTVHWELWLTAQPTVERSNNSRPAFLGKVRRSETQNKVCFNFNKGVPCQQQPCRYNHKCRSCGGAHQVTKCRKRAPFASRPDRA